jgi:hypothetical protein
MYVFIICVYVEWGRPRVRERECARVCVSARTCACVSWGGGAMKEETLDGKNTTHVTTLVAYQRGSFGSLPRRRPHDQHTVIKRSLDATVGRPIIQPFGIPGRRPDVAGYDNVPQAWYRCTDTRYYAARMMDDLEWAVIRMCPRKLLNTDIARLNPSDQKVPGCLEDSAEDDGQCVTAGMRHHI